MASMAEAMLSNLFIASSSPRSGNLPKTLVLSFGDLKGNPGSSIFIDSPRDTCPLTMGRNVSNPSQLPVRS